MSHILPVTPLLHSPKLEAGFSKWFMVTRAIQEILKLTGNDKRLALGLIPEFYLPR